MDTSARSANNVDLAFESLAAEMILRKKDSPDVKRDVIVPLPREIKPETNSCCS